MTFSSSGPGESSWAGKGAQAAQNGLWQEGNASFSLLTVPARSSGPVACVGGACTPGQMLRNYLPCDSVSQLQN